MDGPQNANILDQLFEMTKIPLEDASRDTPPKLTSLRLAGPQYSKVGPAPLMQRSRLTSRCVSPGMHEWQQITCILATDPP